MSHSKSPETDVTVHDSACPLDCPDSCSLTVTVEAGRVTAVGGSRRNAVTSGFICSKVRHLDKRIYHATRLDTPLIREAGSTKGDTSFREASWDEALGLIADKMLEARRKTGGRSILPFHSGGSNGVLTEGAVDALLFARVGATRLVDTLCAVPSGVAATGLYGKMVGVAFDDYVHAECIVIWGANPHASHIHLAPYLKQAQGKGAKLIVIDPRRTKAAKAADLHLALKPGTDVVLALAVARWLFTHDCADRAFLADHATGVEEFERRASAWTLERASSVTGVPAADIERFARMYAEASPALIRCGWGLERNRNGGSAIAAVIALPAVAGKFKVRGGGYTMSNSRAFLFRPRVDLPEPDAESRIVETHELGRALLELNDPSIDLLFVYNSNPLMVVPDQQRIRRGLERTDLFTVVFDQVMTDSAKYADVILPATTFLEHAELNSGYGALVLQYSEPVIEPVGEARPNYDVFADLAKRVGVWEASDSSRPQDMVERALAPETITALNKEGITEPEGGAHPVQFVDEWPNTPDHKVHLVPADLDDEAPGGLYHYTEDPGTSAHPLALISPATGRTISSTFGEQYIERIPVAMHPADAAERGITDGTSVRIFNDLGEVRTVAVIDADQRPGVAYFPKGTWAHNTDNGCTANALCPATGADLGRGACFNDARVQIESC